MKFKNGFIYLLAAGSFLALGSWASAVSPLLVYNTGVDDNGAVLSLHSPEQHFTVTGASSTALIVPVVSLPALGWYWAPAPAGSAWIGPNATDDTAHNDPVGNYSYSLTIDLWGVNPAQVRLSGAWMADNNSSIWLNGNPTGFTKPSIGYHEPSQFLIQSGFVEGINTLEFRVYNEAGPTGLCVSGMQIEVIPEPSALAFCALGALLFRRKSQE